MLLLLLLLLTLLRWSAVLLPALAEEQRPATPLLSLYSEAPQRTSESSPLHTTCTKVEGGPLVTPARGSRRAPSSGAPVGDNSAPSLVGPAFGPARPAAIGPVFRWQTSNTEATAAVNADRKAATACLSAASASSG